jgi:WhiB family redox-sensing transcriptional regulator
MANLSRLPKVLQSEYEWQYQGACVGLESSRFFSPDAERGQARATREARAKSVCAGCPVIEQCRQHALKVQEPYGVWGGLSERDRAEILGTRSPAVA